MIEQIKTSTKNIQAVEVINGFTETGEKLCQKFIQEKLDHGDKQVHVLVKLDELKISHSSIRAFMEDTIWSLRQYKQLGYLAIVAHSNILKALVPIENRFFERVSKGRQGRYFDITQLDETMAFVDENSIN